MKAYDWTKAEAVVAEYLKALETTHPLRMGRTWIEGAMGKAGLVADPINGWEFGESHAAWYACLILSRSITKVCRRESELMTHPSKTATTIRRLRNGNLRDSVAARLLERMIAKNI
jgi:hypothetical protein